MARLRLLARKLYAAGENREAAPVEVPAGARRVRVTIDRREFPQVDLRTSPGVRVVFLGSFDGLKIFHLASAEFTPGRHVRRDGTVAPEATFEIPLPRRLRYVKVVFRAHRELTTTVDYEFL